MSPLIGIAVNMLPELAKRLTKGSKPETQDLVVSIVRDVLKTDDPAEAEKRAADPALSGELRVRLAEIEAEAEHQERLAEQAARQAQIDKLRLELESQAKARADDLAELEKRLTDKQDARSTMLGLEKEGSALAWGPVAVSLVVVVGFFATLLYLIYLVRSGMGENPSPADQMVLQIVNIAVGALTAGFATVVSFWLGSSDGSRQKDIKAVQTQTAVAQMQRDNAKTTRDIVSEQSRQTAALLKQVTAAPAAAGGERGPAKDARQFTKCLDIIFMHEGGFADHPDDPGGATNMGITHKTLAAWRGAPVTVEDVRNLTRAEAGEIYRANYWNALNCDGLPAGVDLVVFDFGVNAGVRRSAKLLQEVVHVEQDGQVGPITLGAAKTLEPAHIINAFSDGRMEHYRSLRHWETFKRGWTKRTTDSRTTALNMQT